MATGLRQASASGAGLQAGHGLLRRSGTWLWQSARRKPIGAIAATWLFLIIFAAVFSPLVTLHDPLRIYDGMSNAPALEKAPDGKVLLLGGDPVGRDLFSRVIYGARVSLAVGFAAVALGITAGTIVGLLSGYAAGTVDLVVQRIIDSAQAIPPLVLALVVVSLLGPSMVNVIIAIGVVMVPSTTRLVRGLVLSIKQNVYIDAARAVGAGGGRIAFQHILPNVTHGVIIVAATWLGAAVLLEATLSFLGQGTHPPTPTWGGMLSTEGRQNLVDHPILLAAPAIAIASSVLAFNFLGDALRDLLDPRLRV